LPPHPGFGRADVPVRVVLRKAVVAKGGHRSHVRVCDANPWPCREGVHLFIRQSGPVEVEQWFFGRGEGGDEG
jgi:hypothetical protein